MTIKASTDLAQVFAAEGAASAIASARRAVLADRSAANSFAVEWRALTQLDSIAGEWRELAEGALEPNVFYEPAFALAAAPVFGRDAGAVLVWSRTKPRRLLGFFPALIERRRYGFNLPVLVGLTHPYDPLAVPLVEREAAEPVIAAWLAHLAGDAALPGFLLLPFLPEVGAFAVALDAILERAQMPAADFNRQRRALLAPSGDRSLYIEQAVGQHQHKELRRHWRRLGETGAVLFTEATEPSAVAAAMEDFFALEASGWKGRAGTATAGHNDLRRFIRTAVCGLAAEGKASIHRILVDGRAIAATITLRSGRCGWFWKIAYDEAFARFSPGVMLTMVLTDELLDDMTIERTDSCATPNHPMINHLWRERLALCNRLVALRPQAPFSAVRRLEGLRSAAIAGAKSLRRQLQRW
ncbi:MAG TPA: GNAT family N-acetyltransferase [Xanthobacteraceae bacterium]|nr:GNAT family N-acetyltransferase [Xanthobacteraceae bacterium]